MNRISFRTMENINGGYKCIYHGMSAALAGMGAGGLLGMSAYFIMDMPNIRECWNNKH